MDSENGNKSFGDMDSIFLGSMFFEIRRDSEFCMNPNANTSVPSFIISYCVRSKGIHPRHPSREFPLGLRAPVLGSGFCRTAQMGRNEPFKQKPAASWGEDSPLPSALSRFVLPTVASRRSGTGLTPPDRTNPSQVFQFIFRGVAFAFKF
jgi:hypothetical protein